MKRIGRLRVGQAVANITIIGQKKVMAQERIAYFFTYNCPKQLKYPWREMKVSSSGKAI